MIYSDTTRISGVFYKNVETTRCIAGTAQASFSLGFDASRSNGLYGDAAIVQPKALTTVYIIKT